MTDVENLAPMMERQLPAPLLRVLRDAGARADAAGYLLYLVGGMVRDLLLQRPPGDPDLMVQADPPTLLAAEGLARLLTASMDGELGAASQFGTVKLVVQGLTVDIATARTETYASPGALPAVRAAKATLDLARRDFTVNAVAADLSPARFGDVLDPHGGVADAQGGALAPLHDASFRDDPTRAFRAVRYESRLGLRMTPSCESTLARDLPHVSALSGDRVRHELERTFAEAAPEGALARADAIGLLRAVHPALGWSGDMSAASPQVRDGGPLAYLALLASTLTVGAVDGVVRRLNATREWAAVIIDAATLRGRLPALSADVVAPSRVRAMLSGVSEEAALAWAALSDGTASARLHDYLRRLRHVRTALTGDDLLSLGVPQGPLVGALLRELLDARLDGAAASRADEESHVRRRLRDGVE